MRKERGGRVTVAALFALLCWSCSEPVATPPEPLPPGDDLPGHVEAMIFGSSTPCLEDAACPSGICTYGSCIGILLADQRWMHARAGDRLRTEVEKRAELKPRVLKSLGNVAQSAEADSAYRSRALRAMELLDAGDAILPLLSDSETRISEEAGLALARLGRSEGLEMTLKLARSERMSVSAEALRALGALPGDASLRELLETLNPELEPPLVRAAIDGLAQLGDPRSIRPLVAVLGDLPGHLQHRVTDTLRSLTGQSLGVSPEPWKRWVEAHTPPAAPELNMRVQQAHDEEGLPAPY